MVQDFSHATIRELIIALDAVERSMLETRFPAAEGDVSEPESQRAARLRLAQLAEQEHRISSELAVRRAHMHRRPAGREHDAREMVR